MNGPTRERFDWLADPQTRHGGLEMIRTAIRRGWLEGDAPELVERRARLIEAMMRLITDPATEVSDREHLQACRLMAVEMTAANSRLLDRLLPRRRKPRRRRMRKTL